MPSARVVPGRARDETRDQGMIRVYFVPSSVAPAMSPDWPKTSAMTGASVVTVSAASDPPWSGSAYFASAPTAHPSAARNFAIAGSVMKQIAWAYCRAPV